ncbi:LptF/LptG family permease [Fulvivirgaceae bacterium BMA10]|uniref:LptF/LptG family permease n=1 Tax=Splendidivirga corallicola TaxID=3051826 RepID=A0ABT8KY88_9BACT|nr:LptF/LptG family permease [Fulvivirgaceae bacterium BMA10]
MIKKLDKLILSSFLGPFLLTFVIVVFILLMQYMLKYFDDFVGKGLGFHVFAELLSYFSIVMTPNALPLAVLLSSLMTFGNLGEHFELTAIKSSGISLVRTLFPIFIFTLLLTIAAYFSNNYIVPRAALNAYSLMYDVRQQKPALDLKVGAFYNGIENYSIKIDEKKSDGETLSGVMIYDHTRKSGNTDVILADSGRMYPVDDGGYLILELFDGNRYSVAQESTRKSRTKNNIKPYVRSSFKKSKMVFSLAGFNFDKTDKKLFSSNRLMKNIKQLQRDIDSMKTEVKDVRYQAYNFANKSYAHHLREQVSIPEDLVKVRKHLDSIRAVRDSIRRFEADPELAERVKEREIEETNKTTNTAKANDSKTSPTKLSANKKIETKNLKKTAATNKVNNKSKTPVTVKAKPKIKSVSKPKPKKPAPAKKKTPVKKKMPVYTIDEALAKADSLMGTKNKMLPAVRHALSQARSHKNSLGIQVNKLIERETEIRRHAIEKHKKYALAVACLVMFLIGAPLGAIIKKGGLGFPVIISIMFFIIFYVINILGEKWVKQGLMDPVAGAWAANVILLPFGLFFLRQARNDARLFEADFYSVFVSKLKKRFNKSEGE